MGYNSGTKSQRELTGTLVQIVQDNASSCADLSRQKNNNMARLVADVCTTMETCNGDTETTYNCIRVLHMLAGTECKTTFRWLKSRKAFDIIAQRLVDTLQREQATEPGGPGEGRPADEGNADGQHRAHDVLRHGWTSDDNFPERRSDSGGQGGHHRRSVRRRAATVRAGEDCHRAASTAAVLVGVC